LLRTRRGNVIYSLGGDDIVNANSGGGALNAALIGGAGSGFMTSGAGADGFQRCQAGFAARDFDISCVNGAGDRFQFSAALNGCLFFHNIALLQYDSNPPHVTTGV
jgi:hypothetical protein